MTVTQEPAPPAAAPPAAAPPAAAQPAERLRWGTLLVVLAGVFMTTLDFFIVNVAIPSVQRELRAGAGADHARAFRAAIEVLVAVALAVAALVQLLPSRSGRPGPSGRIGS